MASASVLAQAKVNLFLRILAREASGYHQLETLFCRLALGDEVHVRLTGAERSLDVAGIAMPAGGLGPVEQNLAWKAALAFAEAAGWRTGFSIQIEKRIPVGGGLGGGSADAGGVLRALNALAPNPLPRHELLRLGAALGADVPVLTQDASPVVLAWGRGDRMLPLAPLPARPCALFIFSNGVSTADAYRWLTASPAPDAGPVAYSLDRLSTWSDVELVAYNEFERVVLPHRPDIRRVLDGLRTPEVRSMVPIALMSGSGATVVALPLLPTASSAISGYNLVFRLDADAQAPARAEEPGPGTGKATPTVPVTQVIETRTADHVEPVRLDD